jgi:hypothetical protein
VAERKPGSMASQPRFVGARCSTIPEVPAADADGLTSSDGLGATDELGATDGVGATDEPGAIDDDVTGPPIAG